MRKKFTAVIALWTTGCMSWQTQRAPLPQDPNTSSSQEKIRVELLGGTQVVMYDAHVIGDSLVGTIAPASAANHARIAIARRDVQRVSTVRFSAGRTIGAVAMIAVAALVIAGVNAKPGPSSSSSNSSCAPTTAPAPAA